MKYRIVRYDWPDGGSVFQIHRRLEHGTWRGVPDATTTTLDACEAILEYLRAHRAWALIETVVKEEEF
jgi:hypothetical protein